MSVNALASKARDHWEKHLPGKVRELKASGTFGEAVQVAARAAQAEIDRLVGQGYQVHEAEEVALKAHVLLPAEKTDDWEAKELQAKEAQYQKEMKDHQ